MWGFAVVTAELVYLICFSPYFTYNKKDGGDSFLKTVFEQSIEWNLDGIKKRLSAVEQLAMKDEEKGYALIFEDGSYVILDQNKQPIEYGPASHSYPDARKAYQLVPMTEAEVTNISRWLADNREKALIAPKENGQELLDCWVGLPEQRFLNYKNWRTPYGYLCGTYAATVLIAYYQDFQNELFFSPTLREKGTKDHVQLSEALRQAIQPLGLPTVPGQVSHGITKFLKHTGNRVSARSTMLGSWQRATKRIRQGKPVILGVLKVLGSTYGNHWVTAYAYYQSSSGERFYKVHDNWGNTDQLIPASWCNGTVSLP